MAWGSRACRWAELAATIRVQRKEHGAGTCGAAPLSSRAPWRARAWADRSSQPRSRRSSGRRQHAAWRQGRRERAGQRTREQAPAALTAAAHGQVVHGLLPQPAVGANDEEACRGHRRQGGGPGGSANAAAGRATLTPAPPRAPMGHDWTADQGAALSRRRAAAACPVVGHAPRGPACDAAPAPRPRRAPRSATPAFSPSSMSTS